MVTNKAGSANSVGVTRIADEFHGDGPESLRVLPPLANMIVDRAIDNANRKLIAGYRNKNNSRPGASRGDVSSVLKDSLGATSSRSILDVASRGAAWKELIEKGLTAGIGSIATMKFDGEFSIKDGMPDARLKGVPNTPGVYVVFDAAGTAVYVGDGGDLQRRWHAGHVNEYRQGERSGRPYKLAQEFKEGCTVKFVTMESVETAAALEAYLIQAENPRANSRQELLYEQGKRSNIEAKKMKDSMGDTSSLLFGAAGEAAKNAGWSVLEQLTSVILKAAKDELVDVLWGGTATLAGRIERFFKKVWTVVQQFIEAPLKLLAGIVEFIVNAFSKALRQVMGLVRNIYDLAIAGIELYKGAKTMTREELVRKLTETVVVSGMLVLWDSLDPVIEAQLFPLLGPVASYLACGLTAIGFGLCSHYVHGAVTKVIDVIVAAQLGYTELLEVERAACAQIILVTENNIDLLFSLQEYALSSVNMVADVRADTASLGEYTPLQPINIRKIMA